MKISAIDQENKQKWISGRRQFTGGRFYALGGKYSFVVLYLVAIQSPVSCIFVGKRRRGSDKVSLKFMQQTQKLFFLAAGDIHMVIICQDHIAAFSFHIFADVLHVDEGGMMYPTKT